MIHTDANRPRRLFQALAVAVIAAGLLVAPVSEAFAQDAAPLDAGDDDAGPAVDAGRAQPDAATGTGPAPALDDTGRDCGCVVGRTQPRTPYDVAAASLLLAGLILIRRRRR